ncbi:hypothetical protein [Paenibacillus sp. NEAU-GSW1]|uniref:hypothetical protein n=1 Tax=Paenibacillus sp. NEAU-GSW1 TaxID=2682486 RepID=UPI0012E21936|nr:hypothetical protein [Paenibacillus sp. NEAU-GSW1]MUT64763.1 hypothetical protein [Paenibacillus sp. NEAU-GSW1]
MRKNYRVLAMTLIVALMLPAMAANASAASKLSIGGQSGSWLGLSSKASSNGFKGFESQFLDKILNKLKSEIDKSKGKNSNGDSKPSTGNGSGNGQGNGNGNGNGQGNGNGNGQGNGNGNGNGNQVEKEVQRIYNTTSAKLFQLRNECQAELTGYAVEFTKLTSTHDKTELYKVATSAFNSCTAEYTAIFNDAGDQIAAAGGDASILEPMQTRYEQEIVAGRAQLNAIVGK